MKITRIEDVYTVPKTEEEWKLFPVRVRSDREICLSSNGRCMTVRIGHCSSLGMTEIPVHHFLDLLNDKIAPWRLLEVGFFRYESDHMAFDEIGLSVYDIGAEVHYVRNIDPLNINTFSELLQMMKFCGWKNEEQ